MAGTPLEHAYRSTHYRVLAGEQWLCFLIDQHQPEVEAQIADCCGAFSQWVVITAHNPASAVLCKHENDARHENLRNWLDSSPYRWLPSLNCGPAAVWPDEPGALILDISLMRARALGRQLGQNAIIHAYTGFTPQLVWLAAV